MIRLSLVVFSLLAVVGCGVESSYVGVSAEQHVVPVRSLQDAIQGGTLDTTSRNVVGIIINSNGGVGLCTGTLIAPNLVLTAHHCVASTSGSFSGCTSNAFGANYAPSSFRVTLNGNGPATVFNNGRWPNVDNVNWFGVSAVEVSGTNICGGDMAVLRLSSNVSSVCPIWPRVDSQVGVNEAFTAIGFGATGPSQTAASGTRYSLTGFMKAVCVNNCGFGLGTGTEFVAQSSNSSKGVCEGDSGGPALDSNHRVIGTVSRGDANSCANVVYESVFGLGTWLKSQGQAAATAGGYAAAPWVTGGSSLNNPCDPTDGGTGGGSGSTGGGTGSTAGGGTGSSGGGTGSTGGGSGTTSTCPGGLSCFYISNAREYVCLEPDTSIPSTAATCSQTVSCASGFNCWTTDLGARCLADCRPGTTPVGGGTGTTGGGSGATGGGTASTGGGTASTGGSTGTTGGGTASTGGSTGTTGGGTASTGGNSGTTGGGTSSTGGGAGSDQFVALAQTPDILGEAVTGCGCTSLPADLTLYALGALMLARRRARR